MQIVRSLFIIASLSTPLLVGCGGESDAHVSDKTDLEQYMIDHPEAAEEDMAELDE